MGAHLERARLLFGQSRHDLAEQELRLELAENPEDSEAHALLALCLSSQERFAPAQEEARQAIALAPDGAFAHYAMARVLYDRNDLKAAQAAALEAARLEPDDPDYHALIAQLFLDQSQWAEALERAEIGLEIDPEHVICNNLRAMALVKLKRRQEAGQTLEAALARDPEDALSHANRGWTLLEGGDPKKAMEHFREALRLQPEMEWARAGIVEALKARHFLYRVMLKYFFWMSKLTGRGQWVAILVAYFGYRFLGSVAQSNPKIAPYISPLLWIYVAFAVMTWIARPFFDLLLRLSRFGRLALTPERITASTWFGLFVLGALVSAGFWIATGSSVAVLATAYFGILTIPVAGTFQCPPGWPRGLMALYTGSLAAVGVVFFILLFFASPVFVRAGSTLVSVFLLGAFFSQWVANGLMMARPRR